MNPQILSAATDWYVQLTSGNATDADIDRWNTWRQADRQHEMAWQNIEKVTQRFSSVPAHIGLAALSEPASAGRRRVLRQLAVMLAVGGASWLVYREESWTQLVADYATGRGETRQIMLADGSRLFLNVETSVQVSIDAQGRTLKLLRGELFIETGHLRYSEHRLRVHTRHGSITALGTQFSVFDRGSMTDVRVYEGAVQVAPRADPAAMAILAAGESIRFDTQAVSPKGQADLAAAAWRKGYLVVDGVRLADFLEQLARYAPGILPRKLTCDPAIAGLQLSGSFPITDIDQALKILTDILPVRLDIYTRYWITVRPV